MIWKPQEGSQYVFLTCPIYEVLYEGTRGPGKTDALLMDFAQDCGKGFGPAWRGILFRESYPQLTDIIAKTKKWFYAFFPQAKYNGGDHTWTWPDGEQLLLRFIDSEDDYWNYHGHEFPWIAFEELTNWPTDVCYDVMKGCNRSSTQGMPRKYRATANPYGPGHNWVKAYFIDPAPAGKVISDEKGLGRDRVRIHGSIFENKVLLKADPDYLRTLQTIKDPNRRKAWLGGSWDITAGGALDDLWDERYHFIPPFAISRSWKVDRSFDWGSSRPFSVGWWAESDGTEIQIKRNGDLITKSYPAGSIFRIAEWYGWNGTADKGCKMLSANIAVGIKKIETNFAFEVKPGPADNSIFDAQEGTSIADEMARQGIKWTKSDKRPGSRIAGLERLRTFLEASAKDQPELPGLYIFNTCSHFKRTVPVLPRDKRKFDDVDTSTEDHVYDETRYRLMKHEYYGGMREFLGF